jgi:hypothetical protein
MAYKRKMLKNHFGEFSLFHRKMFPAKLLLRLKEEKEENIG